MTGTTLVATWVRRFLLEQVVADLNLSRNTQASYRDVLALLLPFAAEQKGQAVEAHGPSSVAARPRRSSDELPEEAA